MTAPRHKKGKPAGDDPELLALGAQLAERRRGLGMLQQQVADAAGVSRSTLHSIEHGATGVRWEKVGAVAEALRLRLVFSEEHAEPIAAGLGAKAS